MQTRAYLCLCLILSAALVIGCQTSKAAPQPKPAPVSAVPAVPASAISDPCDARPLVAKGFVDSPDDFHFVIVSDRTAGPEPGVFEGAIDKVNLLRPSFVMTIGDGLSGEDEDAAINREWDEYQARIAKLDMPFFPVMGNHEASNDKLVREWGERVGPLYYHFVYKNVLFLCLDSQDQSPIPDDGHAVGMSDAQVQYVTKALADNAGVRWTFVFMHQPLWIQPAYKDAPGWGKIQELLVARPHTVFAGHTHGYAKFNVGGHVYYKLATTGGASQLTGPSTGQFDEVAWVTMTPQGPVMANLLLDGILGDDCVTEKSEKLSRIVNSSPAVFAESAVTDKADFDGATIPVVMKNDADLPMIVKAELVAGPEVTLSPDRVEATLEPHTAETVDVKMTAVRAVDAAALTMGHMSWSAVFEIPGEKPLKVIGVQPFAVEPIHACPRASKPVAIDADLGDWADMPLVCREPMEVQADRKCYTGPDDASFKCAVSYDDDYLYVAVRCVDDRLVLDPARNARQQDGIGIFLDARDEAARSAGTTANDLTMVLVCPTDDPAKPLLADIGKIPEGVKAASAPTAYGHVTEVAIPVKYLDEKQGKPWETFRLNVRQQDYDGVGWQRANIYWRPNWTGTAGYKGSGTFRKE